VFHGAAMGGRFGQPLHAWLGEDDEDFEAGFDQRADGVGLAGAAVADQHDVSPGEVFGGDFASGDEIRGKLERVERRSVGHESGSFKGEEKERLTARRKEKGFAGE